MTAIAFGCPSAVSLVPSSGSTATSTSGPVPLPTRSPLKSIGALSFSPSPITTTPSIETVSSMKRIASTAAWSADSLSPRPIQRAAAIAAASVTRTSSSARLRSGAADGLSPAARVTWLTRPSYCGSDRSASARLSVALSSRWLPPGPSEADRRRPAAGSRSYDFRTFRWQPRDCGCHRDVARTAGAGGCRGGLHALGRFHSDEVERARDDRLRGPAQAEAERLRVAAEHAMLVVEAMEIVGHADRVGRQRVRAAPLRRLGDDPRELGEPLHEVALLARQRAERARRRLRAGRVPQDPRDPRVRVLHVVHGVLLALLGGEVDVDVDRLVGPT